MPDTGWVSTVAMIAVGGGGLLASAGADGSCGFGTWPRAAGCTPSKAMPRHRCLSDRLP